jgi:hypothetical protein
MKDILGKGLIVHQGTDDLLLNHQVMLVLVACSAIEAVHEKRTKTPTTFLSR